MSKSSSSTTGAAALATARLREEGREKRHTCERYDLEERESKATHRVPSARSFHRHTHRHAALAAAAPAPGSSTISRSVE
jgi:hypothetical protein